MVVEALVVLRVVYFLSGEDGSDNTNRLPSGEDRTTDCESDLSHGAALALPAEIPDV